MTWNSAWNARVILEAKQLACLMNVNSSLIGVILGSHWRFIRKQLPRRMPDRELLRHVLWSCHLHSFSQQFSALKYRFQDCFTHSSFQTYKPIIWHIISLKPFFSSPPAPFQGSVRHILILKIFKAWMRIWVEEMLKLINTKSFYFAYQETEPQWVSVIWPRPHMEWNQDLIASLGPIIRDHDEHR